MYVTACVWHWHMTRRVIYTGHYIKLWGKRYSLISSSG